ncbi:MAG: hypothetical protein ACREGC_04325, partial [Minisyncoccia bacterium]
PTSEGIWKWKRKDDSREFDLPVYNVGDAELYFRIYFLGAYYDIDDFFNGEWIAKVSHNPDGSITRQIKGWVHPDDFVPT